MIPAYVVFARDKEEHVPACVNSILAQDYSPMNIYFSDQGSTDNTRAAIEHTVNGYNGPNKVRILDCPVTEAKGMAGLISHINWLHDHLDEEFWITCAADDIDRPGRARRTMETLRDLDKVPLFFGTQQSFMDAQMRDTGITAVPRESRYITVQENISDKVGGSCSGAWSAELWQKYGPWPAQALTDIYFPHCAALDNSFYYLNENLHAYVNRGDPHNTGLGQLREMAHDEAESDQILELTLFQLGANIHLCLQAAMAQYEKTQREDLWEIINFLGSSCVSQLGGWANTRQHLTEQRIRPLALKF